MTETKESSRINFKKVKVKLICEWNDCTFESYEHRELKDHLINHLRNIYNTRIDESKNVDLQCGVCNETLMSDLSSIRHLNYHAYIFNLKSRGRYLMKMYKLNNCQFKIDNPNDVPPINESFICQWDKCVFRSDDISEFFEHIDNHPYYEDYETDNFNCKWINCSFKTSTIYRLIIHLQFHCVKRYIACPNCGVGFSTTAKFSDHLRRQKVTEWYKEIEKQELEKVLTTLSSQQDVIIPIPKPLIEPPKDAFKCSLCQHLFATRQMLNEHEKRHISSLTCSHCQHSCSTRYALKRHILFRHTEERPFSCEYCDQSFKSNDVLRRHINAKHNQENQHENVNGLFKCSHIDCNFEGDSLRSLKIHMGKCHQQIQSVTTKVYVCHKCNQEFVKGTLLTEHLSEQHGIKRLSNRARHQYKICKDGKYRLNLFDIRLKSVVETDMNINANSSCQTQNPANKSIKCKLMKCLKPNENQPNESTKKKRGRRSKHQVLLDPHLSEEEELHHHRIKREKMDNSLLDNIGESSTPPLLSAAADSCSINQFIQNQHCKSDSVIGPNETEDCYNGNVGLLLYDNATSSCNTQSPDSYFSFSLDNTSPQTLNNTDSNIMAQYTESLAEEIFFV